jgi:citrate lyase beta subunit
LPALDQIRSNTAGSQMSPTGLTAAAARRPVGTLYGGAHLFNADTMTKVSQVAEKTFNDYMADAGALAELFGLTEAELAIKIHSRLHTKLKSDTVEDFRIDFEDGYGYRGDETEDNDAQRCGQETAAALRAGTLPPFMGIRIKAISSALWQRSLRTLDIFISSLCQHSGGKLPDNFVVTLPKVTSQAQVQALVQALDVLESQLTPTPQKIRIELMLEQPEAVLAKDGSCAMPALVSAAQGRCRGVHFGAYDYTSALSIVASQQSLAHPACDFVRSLMLVALAPTGVWLADGATTQLPLPLHRPGMGKGMAPKDQHPPLTEQQRRENNEAIRSGLRLHYANVYRALQQGYFQGWDLHPAQLPARYAAVYAFFLESLPAMSRRLKSFLNSAAQASLSGTAFDDAATGLGLFNFFLRGYNCGALRREDILSAGVSIDELVKGDLLEILQNRGLPV